MAKRNSNKPQEHGRTGWRSRSSRKHLIVSPVCPRTLRDFPAPSSRETDARPQHLLNRRLDDRAQPFQGCSHPTLSIDSARHSSENQPDFILFIGAKMEPICTNQSLPGFASNRTAPRALPDVRCDKSDTYSRTMRAQRFEKISAVKLNEVRRSPQGSQCQQLRTILKQRLIVPKIRTTSSRNSDLHGFGVHHSIDNCVAQTSVRWITRKV